MDAGGWEIESFGEPRLTPGWRFGLPVAYLAGIVLLFGPISAATGSKDPPLVEEVIQVGITLGMLGVIILALLGRRFAFPVGIWSSLAGVGIGIADVPQVGDVALAELAVFGPLFLLTIWGRQKWITLKRAALEYGTQHPDALGKVIGLRSFGFARQRPRVAIDGTELVLVVPRYFADREWRLAIAHVAALELPSGRQPMRDTDSRDDVVFEHPIRIPFLRTTTQNVRPNLLLLFTEPTETPHLRRWVSFDVGATPGRPWRSIRPGAIVDGVMLRCVGPRQAVQTLAAAGVEVPSSADEWLTRHRSIVTDIARRQDIADRQRNVRRMQKLAALAWLPIWVALLIVRATVDHPSPNVLIALAAVAGVFGPTLVALQLRIRQIKREDTT